MSGSRLVLIAFLAAFTTMGYTCTESSSSSSGSGNPPCPPPCKATLDISLCNYYPLDRTWEKALPNNNDPTTKPDNVGDGKLVYTVPCNQPAEVDIWVESSYGPDNVDCPGLPKTYIFDVVLTSNECNKPVSSSLSETCGKFVQCD